MNAPKVLFRLLRLPPRVLYTVGLGGVIGRFVLLLTTRGRRTGKRRITPLQYEQVAGGLVVASARGTTADWYRNVVVEPYVEVRIGNTRVAATAETCIEPSRIADYLELRLQRHPRLVGAIMRMAGMPARPDRTQLEEYAARRAIVTITPIDDPL